MSLGKVSGLEERSLFHCELDDVMPRERKKCGKENIFS